MAYNTYYKGGSIWVGNAPPAGEAGWSTTKSAPSAPLQNLPGNPSQPAQIVNYSNTPAPTSTSTRTAYYTSPVDLQNAQKYLGNEGITYTQWTPGTQIGAGSLALGGSGVIPDSALSGGMRLGGADRYETAAAMQGYAPTLQRENFNNEVQRIQDLINAANNKTLEAEKIAKEGALRNAFQNNSQALNSQKSTVGNSYDSMMRQLNATRDATLPQYQAQKDSAAVDSAAQMRRVQALNALSGKYFSGANRDQQFNVLLAQKQAEQGINQAKNQFETGVTNRLSDADAQRVAALNDIAEKLRLTEQQYNQGTLDLTNQIESEKAAGAAKAMANAMQWANTVQQQGVDNSLRQGQLDLSRDIFGADQAWRDKTFGADQESAAFNRALALAGLTGYYDGNPTMAREQFGADQAYRNAGLANSRTSVPKAPTTAEINNQNQQAQNQVVSNIYNQIYTQNSSNEAALNSLYSQKGQILEALAMAGYDPSDALAFWEAMKNDLTTKAAEQ